MKRLSAFAALLLAAVASLHAAAEQRGQANYPTPVQKDYVLRDVKFRSGQSLPEAKIHYRTIGTPKRDDKGVVRNAVLILHGTTGSGGNFTNAIFAGQLFGPGQPLDATKYYLIMPDNIGHGQSSKPSDGLHAKFPNYGYQDMIDIQYRLLTEGLNVNHLRLVMGTSMGGMHSWLWGSMYPDYMDALMPLASLPTQMSGRNRVWRRVIIDAIRNDPDWKGGDYKEQPKQAMRVVAQMMWFMADNPLHRQQSAPTRAAADKAMEASVASTLRTMDANNVLYAYEASTDYDPGPGLEKIKAPLVAINFADDLINPPEIGVLEREIKKVKRGRAITFPMSEQTAGHGTHTRAAVWKHHLVELLKESETVQ
jgi:homoserine O-acetyltransferase